MRQISFVGRRRNRASLNLIVSGHHTVALHVGGTTGNLYHMARPLETIHEEIRELSVSDKETLLRLLWEELDGPSDPAVDAAWLEEVQRRSRELDEGLVECIPAEEVFARLEALIKKK